MQSRASIVLIALSFFLSGCLFKSESKTGKNASLKPTAEKLKRTAKLSLGANVELKITSDIMVGESFDLEVLFERESAAQNYAYELKLPKDLKLLNGEQQGQLSFNNDNQVILNFKIQHDSLSNERIGIILHSSSGIKQRFSISSLNYFKDKKEYEALYERSQKYLEDNPEAIEAQQHASDGHNH